EDLHVGAVGGEVSLISLVEGLRPEYSNSVSASVDWYERFGKWDCNLTVEGFFTQLDNVFALVENGHDAQGNLLLTRTNANGARVAGLNVEGKVAYGHLFSLQAGYTYNHSRYIEPFQWSEELAPQTRMFRTPDHYGYFLANIEPVHGLKLTTNGKITGRMLLQHYAGYVEADYETLSPIFFEWDAKVGYEIHLYPDKARGSRQVGKSHPTTPTAKARHTPYTLEVALGVKNLLDHFQRDIDQGMDRDASYIYGPAIPRSYFLSLNLKI
ncbi:MAG: TonB-dependent receptor, partial [Paludibacteraceae bacterium]|nr:TonB-dependent receptor [Paludibacteraceae bacterium]